MMPAPSMRPSVGFTPTSEQALDGQTMEPSVSVPMPTVAKLAAIAAPVPELEPHGLRSSAYGFAHCPPRALQPLEDCVERMFAHSERFVLPRITAPAARSRATSGASRGGVTPASANEPAVVIMRSVVAMLSFTSTGMPCSDAREIRGADRARGPRAGAHGVLQLRDGRFLQLEIGMYRQGGSMPRPSRSHHDRSGYCRVTILKEGTAAEAIRHARLRLDVIPPTVTAGILR